MSSRALAVGLAAVLIFASGCKNNHCNSCINDPLVTKDSLVFGYSGDFVNYFATDSYFWFTDLHDAYVTVDGLKFDGVLRIQIYDSFNFLIFDETFFGNGGNVIYKSLSNLGAPGLWEVVIDSTNVDGYLQVVLN